MKDLQALIDKRAEDKLNDELNKINKVLYDSNELFKDVRINVTGEGIKDMNTSLTFLLSSSRDLRKNIFNANIERYKEQETKKFLKEIEDLKEKVERLNDEISYLQNS